LGCSETSFENSGQETSTDVSQTLGSLELHNDLTHYYNVPGVSAPRCMVNAANISRTLNTPLRGEKLKAFVNSE